MTETVTQEQIHPHWKRHIGMFLGGQAISLFGSSIVQFAVMWYLTLETKSASVVALYAIFAFLPQGLVSLFGGTLADRVNRKLLIIIPDMLIALATLCLALLMASGVKDLWVIFLVVAVRSVGAGFQAPAVNALIPAIVPEKELLRINGLNGTIQSLMGLVAPAAGAAIYGLGGIEKTLYVDVVTAIIGIVLLFFIPLQAQPPVREQESFIKELVEGVKYTATHRFIRWMMTIYTMVIVLIVAPNFLVPLLSAQRFNAEVWHLSAIEVAFSVGTLLGAISIATFLAKRSALRLMLVTSVLFGILSIALALSPQIWITITLMGVTGYFVPLFAGPSTTELQTHTDSQYMGRVMSQANILFTLGVPFGMVALGPITEVFGVAEVMAATGVITIIFVSFAFFGTKTGRKALAAKPTASAETETSSEADTAD